MRKQYHFRKGPRRLDAWDVDRLIEESRALPVVEVPIVEVWEVDTPYWFGADGAPMTVRTVAEHTRLINEADLSYPILLSADGLVMDGMHRVARALLDGRVTVLAKRFVDDPPPDYRDCSPEELPYETS